MALIVLLAVFFATSALIPVLEREGETSVTSDSGLRVSTDEEPIVLSGGSLIGNQPVSTSLSVIEEPKGALEDTLFAGEYDEEDIFFAVCGMKVEAGFEGLVIDSGNSEKWNEGKGGYVTIQDAHTLKITTYSHLSEIYVKSGDFIEKGEVLGSAGSSGDILPGGACQVGIARD